MNSSITRLNRFKRGFSGLARSCLDFNCYFATLPKKPFQITLPHKVGNTVNGRSNSCLEFSLSFLCSNHFACNCYLNAMFQRKVFWVYFFPLVMFSDPIISKIEVFTNLHMQINLLNKVCCCCCCYITVVNWQVSSSVIAITVSGQSSVYNICHINWTQIYISVK